MHRVSLLSLLLMSCASPTSDAPPERDAIDRDSDGYSPNEDCDDEDENIYPGADDQVGDLIDNNCDGIDGIDEDQDGQPSLESGGLDCDDTDDSVQGADADLDGAPSCTDCDDNDDTMFPGAEEVCDGIDQSCSGDFDIDVDGVGVCNAAFSGYAPVDVLLVIDNSCSMAEEQILLAAAAADIIAIYLTKSIDFRIGVLTTDSPVLKTNAGVNWVEPSTPNLFNVADALILQGTGGSADEKGRDHVYAAIENEGGAGNPNAGFYRADAHLDIIALSDEEDHSVAIDLASYIDWMATLKAPGFEAMAHAIVSERPTCATAAEPGDNYITTVNASGGLFRSVCSGNFAPLMAGVADIHPGQPEDRFTLTGVPNPDTLAVDVNENGALVVHYDRSELDWDAGTNEVILPVAASAESTTVIWYAPAP